MSQHVLRFISGKDRREYLLAADRHIMIGGDSGVDLLLVDNKVSRQHAAITTHAGPGALGVGFFAGGTLNMKPGQTSRDGLFSLEVVACLGACGLAPLVAVNGEFHAGATPDAVNRIVRSLRKEAKVT